MMQDRIKDTILAVKKELMTHISLQTLSQSDEWAIRKELTRIIGRLLPRDLSDKKDYIFEQVMAEIKGFGPLEPLLLDDEITEIMVNGYNNIFVERNGVIERSEISFMNDEHMFNTLERILASAGKRINELEPMVDARVSNKARINAVLAPISLSSTVFCIRKFIGKNFSLNDLVERRAFTAELADFLRMAIAKRLNIFVSGGAGVGKTTLIDAMLKEVDPRQRVIIIEDVGELTMPHDNCVQMETRSANSEGKGEVTLRMLIRNALHMRPDRIVVGEIRGEEVLDILQALNTGHQGSFCTVHANSPIDLINRLQTLMLLAGFDAPASAQKQIIASAIDVIVFLQRDIEGRRFVSNVSQVMMKDGAFELKELFGIENGVLIKKNDLAAS